jgi:hypothetical protein
VLLLLLRSTHCCSLRPQQTQSTTLDGTRRLRLSLVERKTRPRVRLLEVMRDRRDAQLPMLMLNAIELNIGN